MIDKAKLKEAINEVVEMIKTRESLAVCDKMYISTWDLPKYKTLLALAEAYLEGRIVEVVKDDMCPSCGLSTRIRNPSGKCDHLYYPDNVPEYYCKDCMKWIKVKDGLCDHFGKREPTKG